MLIQKPISPLESSQTDVHGQQAVLDRLKQFSSCDISDALLRLGIVGQIPGLKLVSEGCNNADGLMAESVVGLAHTVEFQSALDDSISDSKYQQIPAKERPHHVDSATKDSIIVIKAPEYVEIDGKKFVPPSGVWGGLMSCRAKKLGCRGAVIIDGRVRDLEEHRRLKYPIFVGSLDKTNQEFRGSSSFSTTLGVKPFLKVRNLNEPIILENVIGLSPSFKPKTEEDANVLQSIKNTLSSITISPGDYLIGDENGVVSIPATIVEKVLEMATILVHQDEKCFKDLEKGLSIKEVFKINRTF